MFLDVVDYFANNFGLITIALAEVVTIGLILRRLPVYQNHANFVSDIKLGTFWRVSLLVITPLMLGYMLIDGTIQNIKKNYGDYPTEFVVTYGWSIAAAFLIVAIIIGLKNGMHKFIRILPSLKRMERSRCFIMSGSAIMMMVIGIVVIWGGLALSIVNLFKKKA